MKKLALPAVIAAILVGLQGSSQDSGSGADAEVALDTPTKS